MRSRLLGVYGCFCASMLVLTACAQPSGKFNFSDPHRPDQLIVSLNSPKALAGLTRFADDRGARVATIGPGAYLVTFPEGSDLVRQAEALATLTQVKSVEANQVYQLESLEPNDPGFSKTYGLKNVGQAGGLVGADIAAADAWGVSVGARSVLVGIIDSGVDYEHEDLAANIWTNPGESGLDAEGRDKRSNGVDDDGNGLVDDWHGWDFAGEDNDPRDDNSHGTHVAGTIGAVGNNGKGVAGVNWAVSMVPIKIFSASGSTTTELIVRGIDYATSLGVKVTNNSWGGGAYSDVIFDAIARAAAKDVLFVAAAGNSSSDNDLVPHYPSSYELKNVISVAATNRFDQLAYFSNFGARSVAVAAPGEEIYSTIPGNRYDVKSGTSMATPHVTGLAALIASRFPDLSGQAIKKKILQAAVPKSELEARVVYGRVDAFSSLENDEIPPNAVSDLKLEATTIRDLSFSFIGAGDDGAVGQAARYRVRLSPAPLSDEAGWASAREMPALRSTGGDGRITLILKDLGLNAAGYLTVRAEDNVGNLGELSASLAFALPQSTVLWQNQNDDAAAWQSLDAWKLWSADGVSMLSDSPNGPYASGMNIKAVTVPIPFTSPQLELSIRSRWDLEKNYDFGYVDISTDGGQSWKTLDKVNGKSSGWQTRVVGLEGALAGASSFQLRLRFESDLSLNYEGWDVDSLEVIGRQSL